MTRIELIASRWSENFIAKDAAKWLRIGLYAVVIYNIVFLAIPLSKELWGEHSLVAPMKFAPLWTNKIIMLLHDARFAKLYPVFMALPLIGILIYRFSRYSRLSAILVYIGVMVLFNRTYFYLTGGNYLLHILLFYLVFMDERNEYSGRTRIVSNMLSNFAIWAVRIQLLMVYVFTGFYKLAGESWRRGEAVFQITHIDEFTLPWFEHSIANIHWLMVFANYTALTYFFVFPILVWSKKWKLPLLTFGILFHLGLGIIIGVFDFSLVMIVSYAAFLDSESIERIKSLLPRKKRTLVHH